MELATNKEKKKIRATFPNGEVAFISGIYSIREY
jgi:hypothetical protein